MSYDGYKGLSVAVDRGVAFITIDHGPINLFDSTLIGDFARAGFQLESDPAVKVVVLQSANPDFFIAHADINMIGKLPTTPPPRKEKLGLFHATLDRFRTMPKATIAKIEGRCRGGGSELILSCDMRFGARGKASLGQPEVGIGIIPGGSGSVRLPRLLGRGRALEIILGCGDFSADEAAQYGYINRALPAEEITDFVNSLAYRIASFPAETIALAKQAVALADPGIEDDMVREEEIFLQSVHLDATRRRMAAALALGMQTKALECGSLDDVWTSLAGV
jgi:enoyl-CoA hydratase/carnithine racemase